MNPKTETLLRSKLQPTGQGVFEVVILRPATIEPAPLTYLERSLLMKRHGGCVNVGRPEAVKRYMEQGATCAEIVAYLRGQPGCGKTMIKRDLAALSEAKRNF